MSPVGPASNVAHNARWIVTSLPVFPVFTTTLRFLDALAAQHRRRAAGPTRAQRPPRPARAPPAASPRVPLPHRCRSMPERQRSEAASASGLCLLPDQQPCHKRIMFARYLGTLNAGSSAFDRKYWRPVLRDNCVRCTISRTNRYSDNAERLISVKKFPPDLSNVLCRKQQGKGGTWVSS